jgi:hypothetical protein
MKLRNYCSTIFYYRKKISRNYLNNYLIKVYLLEVIRC